MTPVEGIAGGDYASVLNRAAVRRATQPQAGGGGGGQSVFSMKGFLPEVSRTSDPLGGGGGGSGGPHGLAPGSFASKLDLAVQEVSRLQSGADDLVIDLASGRNVSVHDTMLQLEKADIALKYMVQLRNRALSAYDEFMRMQV